MEQPGQDTKQARRLECTCRNKQPVTTERIFVLITIRVKRFLNAVLHYANTGVSPQY